MKIGNITFNSNIFLAPMAGITDVGFRSVCSDFGAELTYTEMVSAKGLYYGSEKTKELLAFEDNCKIKAVQIFGNDADIMANICASFGTTYDIIDINMGCPAPKIFNNHDGSSLMGNINLAREIISKCAKASLVPITVKFRSGIDSNSINAVEFAKMCEEAGASAITIHARTRTQMYSGHVDYDIVRAVKNVVSIPVIGSGDIVDKESLNKMLETGVDAVMIGRASQGNPEIFSTLLNIKPPYSKFEAVEKHVTILRQYFPDSYIIKYMCKHFLWYLGSIDNAKTYKLQIINAKTVDECLNILQTALTKKENINNDM